MTQARRTLLIVDDSPEDREMYRRLLLKNQLKDETYSYQILEAANGRQGLALWQQHQPDILLLDYRLPDLDGLAFLGQLECSTQRPCLPVIMLTGLGNEAIAVKAIKAGAQDYLVKGQITPAALHLAIEGAIESVRLHRELQQRIERERLVAQITQHIRRSLDLQTILQTTVDQVRQFLQTDRVMVFRLEPDGSGTVVTESVGAAWQSILSSNIHDPCFAESYVEPYRRGLVTAKPDIHSAAIDPCHVELLERFQVRANLVVPILQDDQLWGLLLVHHCAAPRPWQPLEVDLLKELANQVSIALKQSKLYQQAQNEIVERKLIEESLRQSEAFKERVLDSSADCIKVLDLEGRLLYMNRGGLCQMEIDDFALFLNAEWLSFWQDEARELAQSALAVAKAGKVGTFQGYCPTTTGTPKWWEVIVCPILDSAGGVERILSISRDVSDRIRFEQEREQILAQEQAARQAAERANRAKDEFLAVLSHELRSPLNPILGWTKLLQSRQFDAVRAGEALAVIERNAKLQAQLIDDLLDTSRIMSGKLALNSTPVDLPFVVLSALETVRLGAEAKQIQIKPVLDLDGQIVLGDVARLQQVMWNLLSNAVKFSSPGGQVTVVLSKEMSGHCGYAKLVFSDTGKGIKPEFLPYLFDYFRQEDASTTRRFGGLGLGLAIVRQIVEMHGGTVEAESPGEGQGATFTVRLPLLTHETLLRREPYLASSRPAAPASSLCLAGIQLLIVDDDRDNLDFYRVVLESSGAKVIVANSAAEALQHLLQTPPDLLISDIGMPDMNGYALMQQVKIAETVQGKQIPAIALTAYASDRDRELALAAGFRSHLAKPIEPDTLVEAIVQLLQQDRKSPTGTDNRNW